MIELLEHCVRIPSLSGQERPVAEFLCREMQQRGYDRVFIDPAGNAVGVIGAGERQIVLLGHMDTVGGTVPVRYDDGKLYGRGTVDAKGALCAFVLAAAAAQHDIRRAEGWQLIVIGATEEEAATSKGARFAATQYRPAYCVIGEPSGSNGITIGYKGRSLIEARFQLPAQHTARPEPSAGEHAVAFWNWLRQFSDAYNADKPRMFDQIMPSLRRIQSDGDGLSEWCEVWIGLRLPPAFGPDDVRRIVTDRLNAQALQPPAATRVRFHGEERAHRADRDSPLAYAFRDAIRGIGQRPAFKEKSGTADFNVVGPIWNCPIVAYGPGDSSLDHTPDEHIHVDEFEKAVKVLINVLRLLVQR